MEIVGPPCFEIVENLSTPSVIFGSRWEIYGILWKSLGNPRHPSEVVGNLQRSLEGVSKSLEIQVLWRRKISCILLKKKLAGIHVRVSKLILNLKILPDLHCTPYGYQVNH